MQVGEVTAKVRPSPFTPSSLGPHQSPNTFETRAAVDSVMPLRENSTLNGYWKRGASSSAISPSSRAISTNTALTSAGILLDDLSSSRQRDQLTYAPVSGSKQRVCVRTHPEIHTQAPPSRTSCQNALRVTVLPHEILHIDPPGAFGSVLRSRDAIRGVSADPPAKGWIDYAICRPDSIMEPGYDLCISPSKATFLDILTWVWSTYISLTHRISQIYPRPVRWFTWVALCFIY